MLSILITYCSGVCAVTALLDYDTHIQIHSNINVDDVAILQASAIRNAMADAFVD